MVGTLKRFAPPALPRLSSKVGTSVNRPDLRSCPWSLMKRTNFLLLVAALAFGCAHQRHHEGDLTASSSQVQAPEFLTGPLAVLLTNAHGYSAHITLNSGRVSGVGSAVGGELTVKGRKLVFAQTADRGVSKSFRTGAISFIWDAAENRGYVLSESLQAYAPISFSVCCTNVLLKATRVVSQRIDGHPCVENEAVIRSNDGTAILFRVWQAQDLNGLPVQITSVTNTVPLALNLSRIRATEPSTEQCQLPDGLTKYDTAEGMMTELTIRQQNLKRRGSDTWGQSEQLDASDAHHY
jgi:hypothetical protein